MKLAHRAGRIQASQTLAITTLVDNLRREGRSIIDLGAGEPDFDTPDVIKEAAFRAIRDGYTKYTPNTGILELREAISEKLDRDNGLNYSPSEIIVTCGAKHAIINLLLALCEKGDEVVIPSPYWTSYVEQVRFVGAQPVLLQASEASDFKITPQQLREVISARTKLFMLNSPGNPTGSVYTRAELQGLGEVIRDSNIHFMSDEIYEKIIYDGEEHVSLAAVVHSKEKAVVVNGLSKSHAMTGWRIGFVAADHELIKAMAKIQSHSTSNPCSVSQMAALTALKEDDSLLREMLSAFSGRRRYLIEQLRAIPGISCNLPRGAFYAFPNVSRYYGKRYRDNAIKTSIDFCSHLLEHAGVAVVPGEAFGSRENVRISYATSMDNLEESLNRIAQALQLVGNAS